MLGYGYRAPGRRLRTKVWPEPVWDGGVSNFMLDTQGSGAVYVTAKLTQEAADVKIIVSTSAELTSPTVSSGGATTDFSLAKRSLSALTPDTQYYGCLRINGVDYTDEQFSFKTPPASGAYSILAASCSDTASNGIVWDVVASEAVARVVHMGDWGYFDDNSTSESAHQTNIDANLANAKQKTLRRTKAIRQQVDDHDACGNDSDSTFAGMASNLAARRRRYPNAFPAEGSIYSSEVIAGVRHCYLDVRSARSPKGATDGVDKTMLGSAQKAALYADIDAAALAEEMLCIWSPVGWQATAAIGVDHWGGYPNERAQIIAYIDEALMKTRTMFVCGDMHAVAYAAADTVLGGMPVVHLAPFDRSFNSVKGGPYDPGPFPPTSPGSDAISQFGTITFTPDGDDVGVNVTAWSLDRTTGAKTELMDVDFDLTPPPPPVEGDITFNYLSVAGAGSVSTFTRSAVALGDAPVSGKRYVVVGVHMSNPAVSRNITGVTVGGVAASLLHGVTNSGDVSRVQFWMVEINTGTSGDIVTTFSNTVETTAVAAWAVYAPTAIELKDADGGSVANPANVPIDCPAEGLVLALAQRISTTDRDPVWTIGTRNYDSFTSPSMNASGMSHQPVSALTGQTVSVDFAGGTNVIGAISLGLV